MSLQKEGATSTGEMQKDGEVTLDVDEGTVENRGKVSSACCQHPEHKKRHKKDAFAEGFASAIEGVDAKEGSETGEEQQRAADEAEGEMISEERLIQELEIPTADEVVNLVQLRIFDMTKVAFHLLSNCKTLVLRQNLIHDLHPLPPNLHDSLRDLDLYDNKIKRIQHLDIFPDLRVLDLSYNNIRIIENLNIPTLEVLFLTENKITKIQNLGQMPRLRQLELGSNRIRVIEGLDGLGELEELWLGKNKISKLQGLSKLPKLRKLSLQANRLTEIPKEAFAANTCLTDLHLSENGIKKIENIAHMKAMRLIDFCFNPITTIDEVATLPVLKEFWLTDARLSDWKEVQKLTAIKTLETVYLERNPVEDARYRHKLANMLPWLKEIDSWPVAKRDQTGKKEDGTDPRGLWVDSEKADITFKASRGEAPIMPSAAEVEAAKAAAEKVEAAKAATSGKDPVAERDNVD